MSMSKLNSGNIN